MFNPYKKTESKKWPLETLNILGTCQHIHKYAEEFYQYLTEVHHDNLEIARMWGLCAIDKCNHSDTFKMAYRLKGEGISDIALSAERATNILNKMKTIPKGNACTPPSVVDALRFAIKMEENLSRVHISHVVTFYSEQDTTLMVSTLQSSNNIIHMMTEEYLNLTILESESF
jgi:rubrerythrin